jgi:hypothetical protein
LQQAQQPVLAKKRLSRHPSHVQVFRDPIRNDAFQWLKSLELNNTKQKHKTGFAQSLM